MSAIGLLGFGEGEWGNAFLAGLLMTVAVSFAGLVAGSVFGALVAWAKLSGHRIAGLAGDAYIAVFRGIPELLVVYFVYFGSSAALTAAGNALGIAGFIGMPSFIAGALAVGIISGAYQAEVYRGAFIAIAKGELEAARAMGMGPLLAFRRIIAPQVLRFAIPGLGNLWQVALKDSSLITVTGLFELMHVGIVGSASTHQPFTFYIAAASLYLLVAAVSEWGASRAEQRLTAGLKRVRG